MPRGPLIDVHYHRPGRDTHIYREPLVSDDGRALRTHAIFTPRVVEQLSERLHAHGVLAPGRKVGGVRKWYFYAQPFDVLAFDYVEGDLAGYYSDVGLPLERRGSEYHFTDLFLDTWLCPDGRVFELDWDEFEAAERAGALTPDLASYARQTMTRLLAEIRSGVYPHRYL